VSGVLCWADAGPTLGLGHLSRAMALGEALAERGLACRFVLPEDATARTWLEAAGGRIAAVLADAEPALPRVLAAAAGADAVVVDVRHPLDRAEVRALGGTRPVAGPYLVRDGVRREFRIASAAAAAEVEGNMS